MGFNISINGKESYQGRVIYRVDEREAQSIKKVWRYVESNLQSCATSFYQIFFRSHPKYVKYFREDNIPEFVLDARMQKKFGTICSILSAFFIDYYNRPSQREHLLGYMAMVHKDMLLTSIDFENFVMSLIDMLVRTQPKLMSAECTLAHLKYLTSLTNRMLYLIELQMQNDIARDNEAQEESKTRCRWFKRKDNTFMYGRPLEYWQAQRRYWHSRLALWASLNDESYLSITRKHGTISLSLSVSEKNKEQLAGHSMNRKPDNLIVTQIHSSTESSDMVNRIKEAHRIFQANKIANIPILSHNEKQPQRDRRRRWRKSDGNFETLSFSQVSHTDGKRSMHRSLETQSGRVPIKNTQAFLDAVQALKSMKKTSDSEKVYNSINTVPHATSFSARERKRLKDNVRRTQDTLASLKKVEANESKDLGVSIQSTVSRDAGTSTV